MQPDLRTDTEQEADIQADATRPPLDPNDRADIFHRTRNAPWHLSFWCNTSAHDDCGTHGQLLSPCHCDCHN